MENCSVINASYVGDLSVKVFFSDNTSQVVNVGEYIRRHPHPQYNRYLDEKKMKKFSLENGNIVWGNNWDLIFPVSQLYSGVLV